MRGQSRRQLEEDADSLGGGGRKRGALSERANTRLCLCQWEVTDGRRGQSPEPHTHISISLSLSLQY